MVSTIDRLAETVVVARQLLQNSPIGELRFLQIDSDAGNLHITGRVCCFYHKQLAQETVRSVAEGFQVVNTVDVD